ncbi:MAG: hypothetical protein AAF447_24595 [Myxococcota bacterium]
MEPGADAGSVPDAAFDARSPEYSDAAPDPEDTGRPVEDQGPPPDLGPAPRLTIGWGLGEYRPIEDGAPVELVRGPQLALHLEPAIRIENLDVVGLTLILRGSDATTGEPLTVPNNARLTPARVQIEGNRATKVGNLLLFESRCQPNIIDRRIRIEAGVGELGGAVLVSHTLEVVLVDEVMPDVDPAAFCDEDP